MTSRERFLTTLHHQEPDRVPYCELGIDRVFSHKLMGWTGSNLQAANLETNIYSLEEATAIADRLKLDNLCYVLRPPVYAERMPGQDGRLFYGDGQIRKPEDTAMMQLPNPLDEDLYAEAQDFVANKGDRAAWFVTRMGIFSTTMSLGLENFCLALYDDRSFVEEVLDRYFSWTEAVAERICKLDFDAFVSTDDMAFKTSTYFSPEVFRDLVLPRYQKTAEKITIPWIIHSDGNILPFLDDLVDLGIAGLHPLEKGAVDPVALKRRYGDKLCLLGNVDLNLLGMGAPERVDQEVFELIRDLGPDGGYVVTSGNSLAGYLIPENVLAMSDAVRKYGQYPLG